MAATAAAFEVPMPFSSVMSRRLRSKSTERIAVGFAALMPTTALKSSVLVRASDPQREEVNSSSKESGGAFTSQEDLDYLWKLGAGSVAGAAAIKYGSVVFPAITTPNIIEAMIIIFFPVIVVVLLLIRQSRVEP